MSRRAATMIIAMLTLNACSSSPSPTSPDGAPAVQAASMAVSGKVVLSGDLTGFKITATDVVAGKAITMDPGSPAADGSFRVTLPPGQVGQIIRLSALSPDGKREATGLILIDSANSFKDLNTNGTTSTLDAFSTVTSKLTQGPMLPLRLLKPAVAGPLLVSAMGDLRTTSASFQGAFQRDGAIGERVSTSDPADPLSDTERAGVQAAVQASGTGNEVNQAIAKLLLGIAQAYQDANNRAGTVDSATAAQLAAVPLAGTTLSLWVDPAASSFKLTNTQTSRSADLKTASSAETTTVASGASSGSSGGGGGGGAGGGTTGTGSSADGSNGGTSSGNTGGGTASAPFPVTEGQPLTLNFKPKAGSSDLGFSAANAVGSLPTFSGLGLDSKTIRPVDFRYYIHDLSLIKPDGSTVKAVLTPGNWSYQNLVLIDHERTATGDVNSQVQFTAPTGTYTGIRFTLGIPTTLNGLATAGTTAVHRILQTDGLASGLCLSGLAARLYTSIAFAVPRPDGSERNFGINLCGQGASNPTYLLSSLLSFDPLKTVLSSPNLPTVILNGFNPNSDSVCADLKDFLANINVAEGGSYTPVSASASGGNDTQCVLRNFGLAGGSVQRLFRKGN